MHTVLFEDVVQKDVLLHVYADLLETVPFFQV